jgi:drug/metabolite transporter (DMT)-like permease
LVTAAVLCWSGNWIVGRAVRSEIPPIGLNFWRWAIACLILAPFVLPGFARQARALRHHWRITLVLSMTGIVVFQALVYAGLQRTPAINAVLMNSAIPLFIILCAWLLDRERPRPAQFIGIAVSFLGIAAIVSRGSIGELFAFRLNSGDLLILAAMPVWGIYTVLFRRRPPGIAPMTLVFVFSAVGTLINLPLYLAEMALTGRGVPASPDALAAVAYVAVFASVIAFYAWNESVVRIGPSRTGVFVHLMPAFGTLLAMLFLAEVPRWYHGVGIALIFAGVWLAARGR